MESESPKKSGRGRPKKSKQFLKDKYVTIRVTEEQLATLTSEAKEFNMSLSEYCYFMLKNKEVIAPFTDEELNLKRGLVALGNNVNQIAHRANQAGINDIENEAKEILRVIRKMVNNYHK